MRGWRVDDDATAPRAVLLECLQAALRAVDARRCVATQCAAESPRGRWHVVAVGKAAGAMTAGALDGLGARIESAIVVTCVGYVPAGLEQDRRVTVIESSHPLPDARSVAAGNAVADFVTTLPDRAQLLWLVSGGASSLVELPVPGVTIDELRRVNAWLLGSGLAIGTINALRRRMSRLKGGGLAALGGARPGLAWMISDVPGNDPSVIGSGLLHAPRTVPAMPELPRDIAAVLDRCRSPGPGRAARGPEIPCRIVASIERACAAARRRAREHGFAPRAGRGRFDGDAARLGARFARRLAASEAGTLWAWGGESTVRLPPNPGRGGRNQQLALAAALVLEGRSDVALLAAGTDGMDGPTGDAGGVVDGTTCLRGAGLGLDARQHLQGANAGAYLDECGDLLHTGPTLTNVGDLVLGVVDRSPP